MNGAAGAGVFQRSRIRYFAELLPGIPVPNFRQAGAIQRATAVSLKPGTEQGRAGFAHLGMPIMREYFSADSGVGALREYFSATRAERLAGVLQRWLAASSSIMRD